MTVIVIVVGGSHDEHGERRKICVMMSTSRHCIPALIPAEACYLGWQKSLVLLAQLVEAGIKD